MINMILDVDGVFNAHALNAGSPDVRTATVIFEKPLANSKPMVRDETIKWNHKVASLIAALPVKIFWLTGWKQNAPERLDALFGFKSSGWIDWDQTPPNEIGKVVALCEFLAGNPENFVWVDDLATKMIRPDSFPKHKSLIVTPGQALGLDLRNVQLIQDFVRKEGLS